MADVTGIGWCDHTMNFWWGCNKVSEECRHCYIAGIMRRAGVVPFNGPMRTKDWTKPSRWNQRAAALGRRPRVFTCSMSDFFHTGADAWRPEAWQLIRHCESLDWLILTKRPELITSRLPSDWHEGYDNVWLGVTAGCRSSLSRLDTLRDVPARVRFLSAEPLLEPLDLRRHLSWLDWVITGCEQAHKDKRRLMDLDWVRDIDRQCHFADVAHFFKQHYIDNRGIPSHDGLIDDVFHQAWPIGRHPPTYDGGTVLV